MANGDVASIEKLERMDIEKYFTLMNKRYEDSKKLNDME